MFDDSDQSRPSIWEHLQELTELVQQTGQDLRECREVADREWGIEEVKTTEEDRKFEELREELAIAIADSEERRHDAERREDAASDAVKAKQSKLRELDRIHRETEDMIRSLGQDCRRLKEERHREVLAALRNRSQK